jgi:hypothetical protein
MGVKQKCDDCYLPLDFMIKNVSLEHVKFCMGMYHRCIYKFSVKHFLYVNNSKHEDRDKSGKPDMLEFMLM